MASAASKVPLAGGNLGCEWPTECREQIEAAAPVDTLVYKEVSAAFDTHVKTQGATFAKRVTMLRATRAAHHNTLQRSRYRLPEIPPDAIPKEKGGGTVAALEARLVARGKEKLNGKCIGLLEGESKAAAQLCNQVNADTQYMLRRNAAGPPEDLMHTVFY